MSLLSRLQTVRDSWRAEQLIVAQRHLLQIRQEEIERWKRATLEQIKASREIATATLMIIDNPDADVREDIDKLVRDLSDQVAKLEEHI